MLKYQLFFFEDLIKQDIRPKAKTKATPDKTYFSSLISELEIEREQTLNSLLSTLLNSGSDNVLELYIQLHQQNLVTLLDLVTEDLKDEDTETITSAATWSNLYKRLYRTLREILTFIEDKFAKYLDTNCKAPVYYINAISDTLRTELTYISERGKLTGCDEKLLDVLLSAGNFYLTKKMPSSTTYHDVFYLKELLERVSALFSAHEPENNINEKLLELLIYLNFNSLGFFFYCKETIKKETDTLSTFREKLDYLYLLRKRANQTPAKPGFIYSKMHPGIQDMIKTWITEEIKYLKEKELLFVGENLIPEELIRWKDFRVTTNFSVPQLGNFLRLLVESGIFLNTNKSELVDFFSKFFTSVKQENISSGSLRTNFYKDDASVSKAVRDILLTLINNSRKV